MMIAEECQNLIKQLQNLAASGKDPEDVDTDQEDHCFDALKYLLSNVKDGTNEKPALMFTHPLEGVKGL